MVSRVSDGRVLRNETKVQLSDTVRASVCETNRNFS